MKIKKFDVVELNDKNKAVILEVNKHECFAEIIDSKGNTIDKRRIFQQEIKRIIYTR